MAVAAFKTYSAGEILTASDLNSSFSQIHNNGEDLGWPSTKAKDFNGFELILDSDGDTSITADTDDQIDFRLGGTDIVRFKTVASAVNGFDLIGSATGSAIDVQAYGTDTNIDIKLTPKGSGVIDLNAVELMLDADADTSITADTDDQIDFKLGGTDIFTMKTVASAVNGIDFLGAATGNGAEIQAAGSDTNIDIILEPKGAGHVRLRDNIELTLGTGGDFDLYFDGAHTQFTANAGDLYVNDGATSRFLFDVSEGDFHADGDGYFFSTSVGSDPRLKEEIKTISGALKKVRQLNGVEFTWKRNGRRTAGLLSTDIKKVLPNAVSESSGLTNEGKYDVVDYNAIIGLLVEAVKELSRDIAS